MSRKTRRGFTGVAGIVDTPDLILRANGPVRRAVRQFRGGIKNYHSVPGYFGRHVAKNRSWRLSAVPRWRQISFGSGCVRGKSTDEIHSAWPSSLRSQPPTAAV